MNIKRRPLLALVALLLLGSYTKAQLTGTLAYTSLATAVNDLNTQGVGAGGVVINITAGNPQTAPAGGYLLGSATLNASTSPTKRIVINGNGNTVTAFTPGTGTTDGIFKIQGVDYLTIDGLNLQENVSNTTATQKMEWGFALVRLQATLPYDGSQFDTIRNCTITMGEDLNSTGIYTGNHIATSTTALSATNATNVDRQSCNSFYGNTISKAQRGLYLTGATTAALYDSSLAIGIPTANNITFGSATAANTSYGIYAYYYKNIDIQNNVFSASANNMAPATAVNTGSGAGIVNINKNNITMSSVGTTTTICGINNAGTPSRLNCNGNTFANWSYLTSTTGAMQIMLLGGGSGADTFNINDNIVNNINFTPSSSGTFLGIATSGALAKNFNVMRNKVTNVTKASGTGGMNIYNMSLGQSTDSTHLYFTNNLASNINATASTVYGLYVTSSTFLSLGRVYMLNNKIDSINITQAAVATAFYACNLQSMAGSNIEMAFDTVTNITSNATVYALGNSGGSCPQSALDAHHNYINNVKAVTVYGISGCEIGDVYNNIIKDLKLVVNGANVGTAYGIYVKNSSALDTNINIYNNFITGDSITSTSYTNPLGVIGIYCGPQATATNKVRYTVYHNTIYLTPVINNPGTISFGAAGIMYDSLVTMLDLRNNIINVNTTPRGTGGVFAVLRTNGRAGTVPLNFAPTSNNNIYYVPNDPHAYVYGEGIDTFARNKFSLVTDPNFNGACGLYKAFMGFDQQSYYENNLVAVSQQGTFAPSGSSYANGLATVTTAPAITTDFTGATRIAPFDAGALQFTAAYADVAGPNISYSPIPLLAFCPTSGPVLSATITDATGVANTAGTKPRIYFKKSTDANVFGTYPADNVSTFNGWKYTEATGTAPNYSLAIDYGKLNAAGVGDSISYFVIAQDNVATPNLTITSAGFPIGSCPTNVNIPSTAGPIAASPKLNGFKIVEPNFTITSPVEEVCLGAVLKLGLSPNPIGATVRWQHNNGSGPYVDIPGQTDLGYTTPPLTGTDSFRVVLSLCVGDVYVTKGIKMNSTAIVSTTPGNRCGPGTVTLMATGAPGATLNWYADTMGGLLLGSGNSFTTPPITANEDYFVSAYNGSGGITMQTPDGSKSNTSSTTNYSTYINAGLYFTVNSPVTILSVTTYPRLTTAAGPTAASLQIVIKDTSAAGLTYTGPVYNFSSTSSFTQQVIPVNITLPIGTYKMTDIATGINGLAWAFQPGKNYGQAFPFTSSTGNITIFNGGYGAKPFANDTSYFYSFFDWGILAQCESPRSKVPATVTTPPSITVSTTTPAICVGTSANINVTSSNQGYNYSWSPNNVVGNNINVSPTTTTKYYVVANDNTNGVNKGCNTNDSITITVNPLPTATATATDTAVCAGDSLEISANTGLGLTYQWKVNHTSISNATNSSYFAKTSGDYIVAVTDANMCTDSSTAVTINVHPAPVPVITANGKNLTATAGYVTYQWFRNGQILPGANTNAYTSTQDGNYTVSVTDSNGCTGVSAPVTTGIININNIAGSIRIYPNPATDNIYVDAPVNVSLAVCTMEGKTVLHQDNAKQLSIGNLADGVYMLRISDSNGMLLKTERIIKTMR